MTGKMFVTKTPASPSKCVVCYTDAKGETDFIDFGTDLDYYGAILICQYCIVNAAELVGMVPVARVEAAELNEAVAKYDVADFKKKVKTLEHLINTYGFGTVPDDTAGDATLFDSPPSAEISDDFGDPVDGGKGEKSKSSQSSTV